MKKRIVVIWFSHLMTDWMLRRQPALKESPFVLVFTERGRRIVKAVNALAQQRGIYTGMVLADCKALVPELQVFDFNPEQPAKLLFKLAEWSIYYTPIVSVDLPGDLVLDVSGCAHLWGGEEAYIEDIYKRFSGLGYTVHVAMADTIGAAWAVCHFGQNMGIVESGKEIKAISQFPPAALRLEASTLDRLNKLGLKTISSFMTMPGGALRRRFGQPILRRIAQALGEQMEIIEPIRPIAPYEERLPCLEPIRTAPGIEIAIQTLLEELCKRLQQESKGLRKCELRCYRLDGKIEKIEIGTAKPSRNTQHLFKLFEIKIPTIEPDLGIELFVMDASVVEELESTQDAMWTISGGSEATIAELLDRLAVKIGVKFIHRYLPAEHYWPERSFKEATSLTEKAVTEWRTDLPRPTHILPVPEPIQVSVPMPDYPPILFRYKGALHNVVKADGPERIEQEWWIEDGLYRDYYCVEADNEKRYWLFRAGDYNSGNPKWFLHGFFG